MASQSAVGQSMSDASVTTSTADRTAALKNGAGAGAAPEAGAIGAQPPFPLLVSPFELRGKRLRNRVMHSSMSTYYVKGGVITDRLIDYHRNRAVGGAAMIVTDALAGLASQAGGYRPHAYADEHLDGLARWA
ncbi:MAG: hypothetical protein JSW68_11525, partial [Burkholderiales bacterium]